MTILLALLSLVLVLFTLALFRMSSSMTRIPHRVFADTVAPAQAPDTDFADTASFDGGDAAPRQDPPALWPTPSRRDDLPLKLDL